MEPSILLAAGASDPALLAALVPLSRSTSGGSASDAATAAAASTAASPGGGGGAPATSPRMLCRAGAAARPGLSTGDVVALIDPATRQPYGVVRLPGCQHAGAGTTAAAAADSGSSGGGTCSTDGGGGGFVLALLDASAPGFQRGSCWLEVFRQGAHVGLRSAAAGLRFLQARRRPGAGAGAAAAAVATDGAAAADEAAAAAAGGGGGANNAQAQALARASRLAFSSLNLGVYEQFELLSPADAGGDGCDAPAALLAEPWQRARLRLRSRLLPAVCLDVEALRVGALASARRQPSPPRRPPGVAAEAADEGARLKGMEATVLRQWCAYGGG